MGRKGKKGLMEKEGKDELENFGRNRRGVQVEQQNNLWMKSSAGQHWECHLMKA